MGGVVVTGGAGLIGSNLVRALNRRGESDILVVDHLNHPGKEKNLQRLRYRDYVDKNDFLPRLVDGSLGAFSTVFHLGACSSTTETDVEYLRRNNTDYTETLCRWCLSRGTRFIYASSAATYGDGALGYDDSDSVTPKLRPLNPYGISKQQFDRLALREGWFDRIVGLKYFNVFGPGEEHKGEMRSVVHKAFEQVNRTGRMSLFKSYRPDYRDGEQERDFLYVDDAVAVTLFFLDHPGIGGLYNCGTGTARTWLSLARAVFAALEKPVDIAFVDMPRALRDRYQYHTRADLRKLRAAGCAHAFRSLEEAVRDYARQEAAC